MTAIIAFFTTSALGRTLGKIGAVLLAIATFGAYQRRKGRKAAEAKQAAEQAKGVREGAEGAAKATKALRDGKTPQEIIDANSKKW